VASWSGLFSVLWGVLRGRWAFCGHSAGVLRVFSLVLLQHTF